MPDWVLLVCSVLLALGGLVLFKTNKPQPKVQPQPSQFQRGYYDPKKDPKGQIVDHEV